MADGAPGLSLEGVSRWFGSTIALAPISLHVARGAVCLVTGANGSGKTTLLRVAAGVTSPSTGTRRAASPGVYLRSGDGGRAFQSPRQAVSFANDVRGAGCSVERLLAVLGLTGIAERRLRELSAGQRARVTLAVALACRPALACLDEPTAHLDGEGSALAGEVVARLAGAGAAVLVATHDGGSVLAEVADAQVRLRGGFMEQATR